MKIGCPKSLNISESVPVRLFDIAEFSTYDGPGVRSVIYFQGCPLKCDWCHSPQSQPFVAPLMFSSQLCVQCGRCVDACHNGVHLLKDGVHHIDRSRCVACGDCILSCPNSREGVRGSALNLPTVFTNVESVYNQVKPYLLLTYENGGITLSGGEPMMQLDGALELLMRCKKDGFHTAVETSGLMSIEKYELLLPWVDLWLWGMRITTGEIPPSNIHLIDKNLAFMIENDAHILPRIPMIPGVMDVPEILDPLISMLVKYGIQHIELNPWNRNYDVNYINSAISLRKFPPSEKEINKASEIIHKRFTQLKFTMDGNTI